MINCETHGGISNRLKNIISCLAEFKEIHLIWEIPKIGGVGCYFNDLFQNKFSEKTFKQTINDTKFFHNQMNTHLTFEKNLDIALKEKYLKVINSLEPVEYVKNKINENLKSFPKKFDTVSVRTFRSFKGEYNSLGKYFNYDTLVRFVSKLKNPIFLTCDDESTSKRLKNQFPNIFTTHKRTKFGDFKTKEGMQDILIDLYLGGYGESMLGTHLSSFSEMQWWFGNCKPSYLQMNLNDK